MNGTTTCLCLQLGIATTLLGFVCSANAEEASCGIVHKQTREPLDDQRYWLLAEHDGRAFVDRKTCLVASTRIMEEPMTLSQAMEHCATLGQGGPHGEMGWQLPTMAELTSLDSEDWGSQAAGLGDVKVPPMTRSETAFWTSTAWLGEDNSYATVTYSAPTTLVRAQKATEKAGVWCVQGFHATGVK